MVSKLIGSVIKRQFRRYLTKPRSKPFSILPTAISKHCLLLTVTRKLASQTRKLFIYLKSTTYKQIWTPVAIFTALFFILFADNSPSTQINKVVSHPTLPLTVTAHEDRHIRFFDNNTGKYLFLTSTFPAKNAPAQMLSRRSARGNS